MWGKRLGSSLKRIFQKLKDEKDNLEEISEFSGGLSVLPFPKLRFSFVRQAVETGFIVYGFVFTPTLRAKIHAPEACKMAAFAKHNCIRQSFALFPCFLSFVFN